MHPSNEFIWIHQGVTTHNRDIYIYIYQLRLTISIMVVPRNDPKLSLFFERKLGSHHRQPSHEGFSTSSTAQSVRNIQNQVDIVLFAKLVINP